MSVAFACATVRCLSWNVEGKEVLGLFHIIAIESILLHHILCAVQLSVVLPRLSPQHHHDHIRICPIQQWSDWHLPKADCSFNISYSWFQNVRPLWATLHSGFCLPEFTDKQVDCKW